MAQSGYTPILIYASGTASNVPLAANLTSSASGAELALNYADGKLYFKNSSGVVTLLAGAGGAGVVAGSNTQIQFNNSGVFGASANLTWDGSKVTASAYQTGGNLTFTGTGNRITGDFSNATIASRAIFQTSTVNGSTTITVIPNGTGLSSQLGLYGSSDPANAAWLQIAGNANSGTEHRIAGTLTGTGTYLPITFFTGGSERMRLDTSGNVVIGNSVDNNTRVLNFNSVSGGSSSIQSITVGATNQALTFSTTFVTLGERMRITGDGNVGIGTSSPTQKLDVNGIGRMRFSSGTGAGHYLDTTGNTSRFFVGTDAVTEAWRVYDSIGGANRIYLDSSGNVGIGTASPSYKLDVSGTFRATGLSNFDNAISLNTATLNYLYYTSALAFAQTGTGERMRIDSSGNLLLGTSSGSARLVVNGGTSTSQIRWEVNNAAFTQEVSTNAAANAYVYKTNDALYHVWKISSSTAMTLDSSARVYMGANAAYGNAKITLVPLTNPTTGLSTNSQIQIGEATSNPAYCLNVGYGLFGDYYGYIQSKNNSLATSLLLNPDGGNVGIGTSSPAQKLDVSGAVNSVQARFGNVAGRGLEISTALISGVNDGGSVFNAKGATAGTFIFQTDGTERMRIDSSGNVGIGTSSPSTYSSVYKTVNAIKINDQVTTIGSYYQGGVAQYGFINVSDAVGTTATSLVFSNGSNVERMRIDSSGNLLVGTTAGLGSSGIAQIAQPSGTTGAAVLSLDALSTSYAYSIAYLNTNTVAGSGFAFIRCTTGGYAQSRFLVVGNGDVQNTNNSYGAISDVKLKENIVDATPKLVDLMQVKIRNYNLIGETTKQIGVVAQELEQVFPGMVVELADKDADNNDVGTTTKSVKYSVFVPILVKAIQEQQALITSLTARIAALEAA